MAGYWPRSFLHVDGTSSRSINTNLANIHPTWPHTWSITHICCHDIFTQESTIVSCVFLQIIYIGGNPYFSNIRDCLNAHFSGNDGLPIGRYLSGPGQKRWKHIAVRWMTCLNPPEIVYYLLEDYQNRHGGLPIYNNAPNVDSRDWESDWITKLAFCWFGPQAMIWGFMLNTFILLCIKEFEEKNRQPHVV